jgi:SEC-C motif
MASLRSNTCSCGSGLPFSRCHGDPANDFARTQALHEAAGIAWMFPAVRVNAPEVDEFAERAARDHPSGDVAAAVVDKGLVLVNDEKRAETVALWAVPYADR